MPILEILAEATGKAALSVGVKESGHWLARHVDRLACAIQCHTRYRKTQIRVSFAELLLLRTDSGYLLVRNQKRKEQFGPFGGVVRTFPRSPGQVDLYAKFRFSKEANEGPESLDLRGCLFGKNLPEFVVWYESADERESTCMQREFAEELRECGLLLKVPADIAFKKVKVIYEGPQWSTRGDYYQFRHLTILKPDMRPEDAKNFWQSFDAAIRDNPSIINANSEEIARGRTFAGELIGNHSCYLFQDKRTGDEPALFPR